MNDWAKSIRKQIENDDHSKSSRGVSNFEMIAANELENKSLKSSNKNN